MRDSETANLAFQASLTGHLVITSLHAEDCAGVCARLRDLGISKDLLHSLTLVISQRLIKVEKERTAVFEVIPVNGKLKLALFQNSFPEYIRLSLHKHGAMLLHDSARKKYGLKGLEVDVITGLGLPTYEDI
jgi:type II secretory ATPase GspE/PulE/Tfp pilus assembly ATPase PilB-like protein